MSMLSNNQCKYCKSKTKLIVKNGNSFNFWCSIAKDCPYSKPMEDSQ